MDIWVVPTFQLLGVMLLWTQLSVCPSPWIYVFTGTFPQKWSFVDNIHLPRPVGRALPAARPGAANAENSFPRKEPQSVCSILGRTAVRGPRFPRLQITYRVSSFTLGSEHTNLWRDPRPILFSWIEPAPCQGNKHVYKQNKSGAGQCQTSLSWPKIQVEY